MKIALCQMANAGKPAAKHTGNQGGGRKRGGFDSVSRSAADGIFSAVPRTGCDAISDFA